MTRWRPASSTFRFESKLKIPNSNGINRMLKSNQISHLNIPDSGIRRFFDPILV